MLAHPSITRYSHPKLWRDVRKHRPLLVQWFDERLGYRLVVAETMARLFRLPLDGKVIAPVRTRMVSRRVLVLTLLAAACAEDADDLTTVQELSDRVRALTARDDVGASDYDPDRFAERQMFVKAIDRLVSLAALRPTDRSGEKMLTGWTHRKDSIGGAYRVDREMLLRLVDPACRAAALGRPAALQQDENLRRRFTIMRRLIELPVCLPADLSEEESAYLSSQRHRMLDWCREMTGWQVEQRSEGIALVPQDEDATDLPFPKVRGDHFGSLLILDRLIGAAEVDRATITEAAREVCGRHPNGVTKWFREAPTRLADAAIPLLTELDLLRPHGTDSWKVMPTAARFRGPEVVAAQQKLDTESEDA
ncbi:TIGR02678 family protein [Nocardiopsis gilva YIM 90087]|uniref:TIGR02678 family protein n=3 Tax=Nocardiopsis gilva TaxID=280236 RepID=A0A223SD03_9ACTN|nr:TIGR02678 family protein [Nocardiopsis gilva YIM 90087]